MRKKLAIAFAAAILSTSLTACSGAGNSAPTRMINQVTDGVEANLESDGNLIYLRNIYVSVNKAGEASLFGTIVNQKPTQDALVAVAINQASIKLDAIPALQNKPIIFGGPSENAKLSIPTAGLIAGHRVPVAFFFGLAGNVSVDALVVSE